MVYAARYNDEIRLWWDARNDKKSGMKYRVYVDGKSCVYTDRVYFNFKNLEEGREYLFEVQLVDENKNIVGKVEQFKASTLIKRELVDITKPPYSAVGDGVTDNTEIINRALSDCKQDKRVYFPFGVYICENFSFSGDVEMIFDVGAIVCSKEKGVKL